MNKATVRLNLSAMVGCFPFTTTNKAITKTRQCKNRSKPKLGTQYPIFNTSSNFEHTMITQPKFETEVSLSWLLVLHSLSRKQSKSKTSANSSLRLCLDPKLRVPKYTVVFYLYLIIIVQPLTN
jgi:hypothetical protein